MPVRKHLTLSFVAAALIAGRAHAQSAGPAVMVPGLWEITVQTRSPIIGPLLTHTVCIDKNHVTRPEPPKTKHVDDCQVLPDAAAANETAYTIRCPKRKITSTSRFSYGGDHFEGTVTISRPDSEIKQTYTAKRIGDCDDVAPDPGVKSDAH
jgi:hypothetical protein